jgi:multisubunit Na+/H+ antiporter MnhC subunit
VQSLEYFTIVLTFSIDVFIFHETFNAVEIIGAIVVIGCTASNIIYTLKYKTDNKPAVKEEFKAINETELTNNTLNDTEVPKAEPESDRK